MCGTSRAGCIRTYLILREKAQRFHADGEIQAALETAMVDRLAEPALASVTPDAIAAMRRGPARPRRDGRRVATATSGSTSS